MSLKVQNKSGLYLGYFDFCSNLVSQSEFKKSPVQVYIKPKFKLIECFKTNLGCIWEILIFFLQIGFQIIIPNSGTFHAKLEMN